jgi:hypothetical protein
MKQSILFLVAFLLTCMVACVDHSSEPTPTGVAAWREGGFLSDIARSIATDKEGNVYITGSYEGEMTFGTTTLSPSGGDDIFVVKYNSQGVLQWARRAGTPRSDQGRAIAVDAQGNVYVTGTFSGFIGFGPFTLSAGTSPSSSLILSDMFVVKYNTNGEVQWAKSAGSTGIDVGAGIDVDSDGNVFVIGYFYETVTFGSLSLTSTMVSDAFIAKYNTSGDVQWAKKIGGGGFDYGQAIEVDTDGGVYVAGTFEGTISIGGQNLNSKGFTDIFLAKFNKDGNALWALGAGGVIDDYVTAITVAENGNVSITGSFQKSASFEGATLTSNGDSDLFVASYNPSGALQWVRGAGGIRSDASHDVIAGKDGNIYIAGTFRESLTLGTQTFTTNSSTDILLLKFNKNGALLWAKQDGGPSFDNVTGLALNPAGGLYAAGYFQANTTLGGVSLTSAGINDVFVVKYRE